jgi:hypothetical protein
MRFKDLFERLVFLGAFGTQAEMMFDAEECCIELGTGEFLLGEFPNVLKTGAAIGLLIARKSNLSEKLGNLRRSEWLGFGCHVVKASWMS